MDSSPGSAPHAPGMILTTIAGRPGRPACLDHDPTDHQIRPCEKCSAWWAEVVRDHTGLQVVREWHDPSCPRLIEWE